MAVSFRKHWTFIVGVFDQEKIQVLPNTYKFNWLATEPSNTFHTKS